MRNAFADQLFIEAEKDKKIVFLSGDIGNRLFDKFKTYFPNRFYNCGVAEANMTGVAAGLAKMGFLPITYTIAPFNTFRNFEQIKIDIAYPNLPVIIVGTGAGLSYGNLGVTHHSLEDIAVMRSLPNLNVVCPADPIEVKTLLSKSISYNKPIYFRIGKKGERVVHNSIPNLQIGKIHQIYSGNSIAIVSIGNMLPVCLDIYKSLYKINSNIGLYSMHTIKPLDRKKLSQIFENYKYIFLLEEHSEIGGAASAILEWKNKNNINYNSKFISFSSPDIFLSGRGSQQEIRDYVGLEKNKILKKIKKVINA